jgi:YebC/PmpR family DNA-binding regulatory protein
MGKGWKTAGIAAKAAQKGARFTKFAREIQVAAKMGGADPEANSRLRMAVDAARAESVPRDTIERAIKKGAGLLDDGTQIEEVTYEGYGPHQVGMLVECQTDNRNRTAADIRTLFNKNGGHLGELGSVAWMFERIALIEGTPKDQGIDPETEAIEAGANEVESMDEGAFEFSGSPEDLKSIEIALTGRGWKISKAEMAYKAKNETELSEEQRKEVLEFIHILDENDDTYRIYTTASF